MAFPAKRVMSFILIEPRAVLEAHGADALRYWAASSKLGEDLDYQEKELITGKKFVTKEIVQTVITNKTGVKLGKITEQETEKLLSLENLLHGRVVGQDDAVKRIANTKADGRNNKQLTISSVQELKITSAFAR
jgi:ATP-dependent Clp protease ATP-binding subunit ClpA